MQNFIYGKCRLMLENSDFGIQEIFACEIQNPRLWSPEYSPRDLESF